jgi:hypothetical protein
MVKTKYVPLVQTIPGIVFLSISKIRHRSVKNAFRKIITTKNVRLGEANPGKLLIFSVSKINTGMSKTLESKKKVTYIFPRYEDFHFKQLKITYR